MAQQRGCVGLFCGPWWSQRPSGTKVQAVEVNRISTRLPALRIATVSVLTNDSYRPPGINPGKGS